MKLVLRIIQYWQVSLSKICEHCCAMQKFLSNSGRCMSCRVTIWWPWSCPDMEEERSFGITPWGKLDFLIRQQDVPELSRMQRRHWLCKAPIVFTVQMVAGFSLQMRSLGPGGWTRDLHVIHRLQVCWRTSSQWNHHQRCHQWWCF